MQNATVLHVLKKATRSAKEILDSEHSSIQVNSLVSDGVIGNVYLEIKKTYILGARDV